MRGKDLVFVKSSTLSLGSPPRAREGPSAFHFSMFGDGITPACAGRTLVEFSLRCRCRDHPRVRGKDSSLLSCISNRSGSPPRAREGHLSDILFLSVYRITPACAGRTASLATSRDLEEDHPRVRGKDSDIFC